jgi:multidrug efflux pump subunit AcrA (membrane-fusion protein)
VVAVGSVLDADTRTLPVLYELDNAEGGVLVGSVVQVLVQGGEMIRGVRIPRSAALEEDGQLVAFVQTSGEGFARRVLDVAGADVETLILRSGVLAGERVVTGAASYVRLASLSTTVPAHGHAH